MLRVLKILGGLLVTFAIVLFGIYLWASAKSNSLLSRTIETHTADFPVPFPFSEEERIELGLTEEEARGLSLERAVDRR
jgi:hypothetical protein